MILRLMRGLDYVPLAFEIRIFYRRYTICVYLFIHKYQKTKTYTAGLRVRLYNIIVLIVSFRNGRETANATERQRWCVPI